MTQPQDPRKHPLQDDEVALARVLRALPTGEPPARVDDAILRAATDAVSPGRRRPARGLRWLPTWAVGTAAAAVLAVGIGLQLRPPLPPEAGPASVSEAVKPLPQARERLSVDLVEPDQALAPPPASAPPEPRRATRNAPPPPPPPPVVAPAPAAVPQAFPAPVAPAAPPATADARAPMETAAPAPPSEESENRLRSEATDQARRVHQEAYARRAQAQAKAAAPQPAVTAPAPPAAEAASAASAAAGAPAAEALADAADVLPPVAEDARLAPDAWLDRIRERRRQGDGAGARASLRLFVQAHPEAPIPSDLTRLR